MIMSGFPACVCASTNAAIQVGYEEKFLLQKSGEALERAAQGGGRVTIAGGVQELWRRGTEGHGQWAWWDTLGLEWMILEVFCNLYGSMRCAWHLHLIVTSASPPFPMRQSLGLWHCSTLSWGQPCFTLVLGLAPRLSDK